MTKAIVVVDFAYKGPKRRGHGTGHKGLRNTLKYLQYRDNCLDRLGQVELNEHWYNGGLGTHYREILNNCDNFKSMHVLAWTWVVSPAPDLMVLVPENQRLQLVCDLTEGIVEDYYTERGFDLPEYSYVLHDRSTNARAGEASMQHLHTHVVLPGTAPTVAERVPVYNNKAPGHIRLFHDIATRHFATMLDEIVGPQWRLQRDLDPDLKLEFSSPDVLASWLAR